MKNKSNLFELTEIEVDGELYKKVGKYWVDEHYFTVDAIILNKIYEEIVRQMPTDYSYEELVELSNQLSEEELSTPLAIEIYKQLTKKISLPTTSFEYLNDLVRRLKNLKLFAQAISIIKYLIDYVNRQFNETLNDEWKWVQTEQGLYATLMSCLRGKGDPQGAIDTFKFFCNSNDSLFLTPLICTSAAAAYCDLKDYRNAVKLCDQAYYLQGGSTGFNELSLVYRRIESETGKSISLLKQEFGDCHENRY